MKRFRKIYLEISNRCNLRCAFCPGTARPPRAMTEEEFSALLPKLRPYTDYLYFHLMGEPLAHPLLESFLTLAHAAGFKVILTTNGTLLKARHDMLLRSPGLHKVNVSLHAFEANDLAIPFETYLDECLAFGRAAAGKKLVIYRLWNGGGMSEKNDAILSALHAAFPAPWVQERRGVRIGEKIYLHPAAKFDWPDLAAPEWEGAVSCYGLRDQIGVLCNGTVVPCCLDHEGDIPLGNLFEAELSDILAAPRSAAIRDGFARGCAVEPLCRRCGFARSRFSSPE